MMQIITDDIYHISKNLLKFSRKFWLVNFVKIQCVQRFWVTGNKFCNYSVFTKFRNHLQNSRPILSELINFLSRTFEKIVFYSTFSRHYCIKKQLQRKISKICKKYLFLKALQTSWENTFNRVLLFLKL